MRNLEKCTPPATFLLSAVMLLAPAIATPNETPADPGIKVQAQLWEYDSFCNFEFPPNPPKRENRAARTAITRTLCAGMEEEVGSVPKAVLVSFTNSGNSASEIPVSGLGSIGLSTPDGSTSQAVAFLWPIGKTSPTFVTEIQGTWAAVIQPGETVDLVFLFSAAAVGDKITIGPFPPEVIH